MEYVLTIIMCAYVVAKTQCMPPLTLNQTYKDGYTCMLDGYTKSYDKIVEIGREEVNKYNIYIKFGCSENIINKKST